MSAFSVYGSTKCTVNIFDNVYERTDTMYPEYAGLLLVQPVGLNTTTFSNVTINLDNNVCLEDRNSQLFYLYCGERDMQFNADTCPKVFVNGKYEEIEF